MTRPATSSSSDPKKIKLRASCDGCYATKVKCNKARPLCSRCLTYGTDCVYSPSSRSGRAKRTMTLDKKKVDQLDQLQAEGHEQSSAASPFLDISTGDSPVSESYLLPNTPASPTLAEQNDSRYYDIAGNEMTWENSAAGNCADFFDFHIPWTAANRHMGKIQDILTESDLLLFSPHFTTSSAIYKPLDQLSTGGQWDLWSETYSQLGGYSEQAYDTHDCFIT